MSFQPLELMGTGGARIPAPLNGLLCDVAYGRPAPFHRPLALFCSSRSFCFPTGFIFTLDAYKTPSKPQPFFT